MGGKRGGETKRYIYSITLTIKQMANTRYSMILKMLKDVDTSKEYSLDDLKRMIKMYIATRDKIVIEILHTMQDMGFIKENTTKPFYYTINKNGG